MTNVTQATDISKMKINKQFKIINTIPKLRSVPATPQYFDMAGGYISYPSQDNLLVEAKKFEIQGGMFSAITGFFAKNWLQIPHKWDQYNHPI